MNTLCFASNLTSAEWAAWVQAIGSIVAILVAVLVAVWQSGKQHKNALNRHIVEQRYAKTELAKTLLVLAERCTKVVTYLADQVGSREAIYEIVEGDTYFDLEEVSRLDVAIAGIPVQNLPSSLVEPNLNLSSTVRQFLEKVQLVLRVHRKMDAAAFADFFKVTSDMTDSLKGTCSDIAREVERIQKTD